MWVLRVQISQTSQALLLPRFEGPTPERPGPTTNDDNVKECAVRGAETTLLRGDGSSLLFFDSRTDRVLPRGRNNGAAEDVSKMDGDDVDSSSVRVTRFIRVLSGP
jgi:hypothetical protein